MFQLYKWRENFALYVTTPVVGLMLIVEDDKEEEEKDNAFDEEESNENDFDEDEEEFNISDDCEEISIDVYDANIAIELREGAVNDEGLSDYSPKSSYETLGPSKGKEEYGEEVNMEFNVERPILNKGMLFF